MIKAKIAPDTDHTDRRRADRTAVDVEVHLRELGATGVDARVVNISGTGFMAETAAEFEVGARVWLIIPGRDRANAVIKWVAAGKLGAEFAEPIDPHTITSDEAA